MVRDVSILGFLAVTTGLGYLPVSTLLSPDWRSAATSAAVTAVVGFAGFGLGGRRRARPVESVRRELGGRIWDAVDNGLVVVNQSKHIVDWNPAMERFSGMLRQQAIGAPLGAVAALDHPEHQKCLELALTGVETATSGSADGTGARAYYSPVRQDDGQIAGALIVVARSTSQVHQQSDTRAA
jgi:PAS domain S-box-containing protein